MRQDRRTREAKERAAALALIALAIVSLVADVPTDGTFAHGLAMGARNVLVVGTGAAVISTVLGAGLAATAWGIGGVADGLVTRIVELCETLPGVTIVAMMRVIVPHPSVWMWMMVVAIVRLPEPVRLVRAQLMMYQGSEFVVAARAIGASRRRIVWHHLGPHLAPALVQSAIFGFGAFVLLDGAWAALQSGSVSAGQTWGAMIVQALAAGRLATAVLSAVPVVLTVWALSILADVVTARFDPHRASTIHLRGKPVGGR